MVSQNKGTVTQIIGPVLDIQFAGGQLPALNNAITVQNGDKTITLEVAQHIGDNVVRCIAMSSTDGLVRGVEAVDTGESITVPVGRECLGRIFNLLGAFSWVVSITLAGYFFGNLPWIQQNLMLVILLLICIPFIPAALAWWRQRKTNH